MSNFIGQTAEFANRLKKERQKRFRDLKLNNPENYSYGFDPDIADKQSKYIRQKLSVDNQGNILDPKVYGSPDLSEAQIKRNFDIRTRELFKRDGKFKPATSLDDKLRPKTTQRRFEGLSEKNQRKILQKRFAKEYQNDLWDEPLINKPKPVVAQPKSVPQQPKPLLALPPAKTPLPEPVPTPKSIPVTPKAKKFKLNKWGVGAGLLGGAAVVGGTMYGLNKLKQRREQNKRYFSRNNGVFIADFAKPNFKNFADNNPLGKFFFKNADTVTRVKPGDIAGKTTNGLWNSGKTFSKRGMATIGVPLTGLAAWQGKKVYDDYAPKIKAGRKLNKMINSVTDKFKQD